LYQNYLNGPNYEYYTECFAWVDHADYSDTAKYGENLQYLEPWKLFLLEVFFQTHPHYQTAEDRQVKYKPLAENPKTEPELVEKKKHRISELWALTYPASLRQFMTLD